MPGLLRTSRSRRGFTLIEVLVAFVILAFSMGALMNLFSGSMRSVTQGEEYAQATDIARAQLARLDADGFTEIADETGETEDGYLWRMEVAPMMLSEPQPENAPYGPVTVTVTVSWGGMQNRSVALTTVRLVRR